MHLYRLAAALCGLLGRTVFRAEIRGVERVPAGGFVLGANHLSGFDAVAIGGALFPRRLGFMAKRQLFARPLLGPLVKALGGFPSVDGVGPAIELARAGQGVVIFPEGARRRLIRRHRVRTGAARIALEGGVPLVPAALWGTDGWRRVRRWRVVFGPPVPIDDLRGTDPNKAAQEATERLWEAIVALEAELDR